MKGLKYPSLTMPVLDLSLRPKKKQRIPVKKTEHFHKNKKKINRTIRSKIDDHEIIYGARALNKRLPNYLKQPTTDYDIYSPYPKRDAHEVERALDKKFKGDHFFVEPATHPGTFRVKAHATGVAHVDYTKPEEKIPYDIINGKKYVKLSFMKKHINSTLNDPDAGYRHEKDRDALNRIKIYERRK